MKLASFQNFDIKVINKLSGRYQKLKFLLLVAIFFRKH